MTYIPSSLRSHLCFKSLWCIHWLPSPPFSSLTGVNNLQVVPCVLLRPPASSCVLLRPPASSCVLLRPPASSCVLLRPPASPCVPLRPPASPCVPLRPPASPCVPLRYPALSCVILRVCAASPDSASWTTQIVTLQGMTYLPHQYFLHHVLQYHFTDRIAGNALTIYAEGENQNWVLAEAIELVSFIKLVSPSSLSCFRRGYLFPLALSSAFSFNIRVAWEGRRPKRW